MKEYLSQQQRELSTFSLDDLKLPKIENSADSIDVFFIFFLLFIEDTY